MKKATSKIKKVQQLSKEDLLAIYNESSDKGKAKLQLIYGKATFVSPKIIDRIKSFKDVLAIAKPNKEVLDFIAYKGKNRKIIGAVNFVMAELIAEVYREDWVPDYTNGDQYKWFPVLDGRKSFSFSRSYYGYWGTCPGAGSRLCFETEEKSNHAGKLFLKVYQELAQK